MASPKKPTRAAAPKAAAKTKTKEKAVAKPAAKAAKPAARHTPPAPSPAPAAAPTPKPTIILTAADREWLNGIRDGLIQRRQAITNVVQANREMLAANEGDPSDIADRASDGFEDELTAGLLTIEANQLELIDAAIARIDKGEYGLCIDCVKPIPRKRLEVLPFAKRCLKCEGDRERRQNFGESAEDSEEEEELD